MLGLQFSLILACSQIQYHYNFLHGRFAVELRYALERIFSVWQLLGWLRCFATGPGRVHDLDVFAVQPNLILHEQRGSR